MLVLLVVLVVLVILVILVVLALVIAFALREKLLVYDSIVYLSVGFSASLLILMSFLYYF